MNTFFRPIIPVLLFILSVCSCNKTKENTESVTFDVGFEDLKNYQGVYKNNGEEEVFFFKSDFTPQVKFYDLNGNLKDSFSLQQIENKLGHIGRFSVISKDTMIVVSYKKHQVAGINRDGSFLFNINLDSLCSLTEENRYNFVGSLTPSPIYTGNDVFFILIWSGKYRNNQEFNSKSKYYKHILESRMHSPIVCKVESVFSKFPQMKYGLRNYYYNRSPEIRSYGFIEKNFVILNNKLFVTLASDRNIYELDVSTLNVIDTILVVPQQCEIPSGIMQINKAGISGDKMAEKELKDKCHITNMLYSDTKKQYYLFLKTGKDKSAVDESGYPFILYVYDEHFTKKKEYPFLTDEYNPKSAMMTSRGIMIEKTKKEQPYGKRTFQFMDL